MNVFPAQSYKNNMWYHSTFIKLRIRFGIRLNKVIIVNENLITVITGVEIIVLYTFVEGIKYGILRLFRL